MKVQFKEEPARFLSELTFEELCTAASLVANQLVKVLSECTSLKSEVMHNTERHALAVVHDAAVELADAVDNEALPEDLS